MRRVERHAKEPSPAEVAPATIHGVSFNPADRTSRRFGMQDLDRELADDAVFSWIDVEAPDIRVLNDLLRRWDIDLVLTSHFDEPEILPRLVEGPECLAFHLYEVVDPEEHLDTSRTLEEIDFGRLVLVLGSDFVITYHRRPLAGVEAVKTDCVQSFRLAGKTPGFIAFLFFQSCLYDYAHLNLANDNFLDVIEERLYRGRDQELATGIAVAGRNILTLKKLVASLHIVLMRLATKRSPFISAEARVSFQELQQNAQAVRAAVDSSRDMLDGILAAVQASASKRTAEVARVLTVLSGILLPLTLVTGIYGMNFEHMPELKWRHGYFVTVLGLGLLGLALFLLFRRLGWVGSRRSGSDKP
jgi:magnesium transporter